MGNEPLTIGELSRRTGVPVKTLRFYSDEGLIPLAGRTSSRYRLYAAQALVRVDLIRTLRDAGLGLDAIKKVLGREMPLADALRLQLAAIEAHVASLQRIGAALRAALRTDPSEDDLKRIFAVTRLSNEERKAVIERFYDRVSEGIPIDEALKRRIAEASTGKLPDDPTPAQLDAWIELAEMVSDPAFIENARSKLSDMVDMEALKRALDEVTAAAKNALMRSVPPESKEARCIVERYAAARAAAKGGAFDRHERRRMHKEFSQPGLRVARYWELLGILHVDPSLAGTTDAWIWIKAAVRHHFAEALDQQVHPA